MGGDNLGGKVKVYLAARYSRRDELREYRKTLEIEGVEVVSSWLDETSPLDGKLTNETPEYSMNTSNVDIRDVKSADCMVFFSEDPLVGVPRGSRHVEFGYAHALEKPIYVIGPKENVFHYRERVYHYDTFEKFIKDFRKHVIVR